MRVTWLQGLESQVPGLKRIRRLIIKLDLKIYSSSFNSYVVVVPVYFTLNIYRHDLLVADHLVHGHYQAHPQEVGGEHDQLVPGGPVLSAAQVILLASHVAVLSRHSGIVLI